VAKVEGCTDDFGAGLLRCVHASTLLDVRPVRQGFLRIIFDWLGSGSVAALLGMVQRSSSGRRPGVQEVWSPLSSRRSA
jgi:hypothetical protein